jgi:predicted dehydrogenase
MEIIAQSEMAEIGAIADASDSMLDEARKTAPRAEIVRDLAQMLTMDLDGVVIATPSALHAGQSIEVLERKMAVFCQKPLGRSAKEVREVLAHAKAADRLLGVDLSYRFTDAMRKIREVVQSGEIGDVYAIDLTFHNAYGPDKAWFYDRELSGGGCVMDLGVHLVDLALWIMGFPKVEATTSRLFAQGKPLSAQSMAVEDYAIARLDLSNGATVQLSCSWNLPAGCDAIIGATFYGTRGGASLQNVNGSFYDFKAERFRGTSRQTLSDPPDAWGGRAGVDWVKRLSENRSFDPQAEQLAEVAQAIDAIYGRTSAIKA